MTGFTWVVGLGAAAVVAQVLVTRLRRRGGRVRKDTNGSSGTDTGWLWFGDYNTSDETETDSGGDDSGGGDD